MYYPTYGFLDLLFILALGSLIFVFKNTLFDTIYLSILNFLTTILMIVSVTFNKTVGDVFSLINLFYLNGAADVIKGAIVFNVPFLCISLLLSAIHCASLITINHFLKIDKTVFNKACKNSRLVRNIVNISICVLSVIVYTSSIVGISLSEGSADSIMLNKVANFKKYGFYSYYFQEVGYMVNPQSADSINAAEFDAYFDRKVDTKNTYSGLLKDYNVVNIMIETGDDLMMNPYLAPTFFDMINNDGINMPKNVSKNKTNVSEFIGIVGSAPIMGVNRDDKFVVPFAASNLLKDKGYNTVFYHDVPESTDIYNRRGEIPQIGFEEFYLREEMFPGQEPWNWGNYTLDSDCFEVVSDSLIQKTSKPFYAFYTTLSMHGPYVSSKHSVVLNKKYGKQYDKLESEDKFINPLKGTINENCIRNYALAVMDFDAGLKKLVDKFKATKYPDGTSMYDKTLFVIYGDHEIYYAGADNVPLNLTLTNSSDAFNTKMYKTALTFINPTLRRKYEAQTGTNIYPYLTSPYNICPTVLDLLGVNYNPNFYIGNSVFNEAEMSKPQLHYSLQLSGFFNDDFWANNDDSVFRTFNPTANKEEFLQEVSKIMKKEEHLDKIYRSLYFKDKDFKDFNDNYLM